MKAAGACRCADLRFKPPMELGKVAFFQAQSDKGPPAKSHNVSLIRSSKAKVALFMNVGGQHLEFSEREARSQKGSLHLGILKKTQVGNCSLDLINSFSHNRIAEISRADGGAKKTKT